MVFDKPGVITVLCFASIKGLEFDSVFIPEMQSNGFSLADATIAKMNLYVATSRAREYLHLLVSDPNKRNDVWKLLPPEDERVKYFDSDDNIESDIIQTMNYPAAELRGITYGIGSIDSQQAVGNQTRKRLKKTITQGNLIPTCSVWAIKFTDL